MRNLYSKKWHEHKIGLARVQQKLESVPSTEAATYFDSTIPILEKFLRDPLYNDRRAAGSTLSTMNEIFERDEKVFPLYSDISFPLNPASSDGALSALTKKKRPSSATSKATYSSLFVNASPPPKVDPWQGNKYLERENTIVPALRVKLDRSDAIKEESDLSNNDDIQSLVPPKERVEYSRAVDLFGHQTMRNLYSKKWHEHKIGLARVQQKLESVPSTEAATYFDSTIPILEKFLRDPLYNVYATALDLLSFVCTKFVVDHHLQKMAPKLARTIHTIIAARANDTDRRAAGSTLSTMNEIFERDEKVFPLQSHFISS
ncbi:HEAT repeat protein [Cooperia oncophora]